MAKGLVPSPSIDDEDLLATPERRATERRRWWRSILGSGLAHALILALLLGLWWGGEPAEFPPIPVTVVPGIGAAGTAGGSGAAAADGPSTEGAATETQDASATAESAPQAELSQPTEPPQPAELLAESPAPAAPETPQTATTPPPRPEGQIQASAPPPTEPAERVPPVPPHKPKSQPAPKPVAAGPPPPTRQPAPQREPASPALTAASPSPAATPGTPGAGQGIGGADGRGQGVAGAGEGALGAGKGPGDDYLDRVRRHIRHYLTYPEVARKQKREGDATMAVLLRRDGTVLSAKIEQSTGYPELDDAMLRAVHDASPVPPFPKTYEREEGEVVLPFDFHLGFIDRIFR